MSLLSSKVETFARIAVTTPAMLFRCQSRFLLCLALVVLMGPVSRPAAAHIQKRIYHPIPESIPDASDPGLVIDLKNLDAWEELPPTIDTTGYDTFVFGREDGEDYELLGHVADIATDGKGTIFILDAMSWSNPASAIKTVHVIDAQANYLGNFGRAGEGPGEFRSPQVLMVADGGNTVLVAGGHRQVVVFKRTESSTFLFDRNLRTKTSARAGCIMRDHFYSVSHDLSSGHVIHKYTMDGAYVKGFGASYDYENPSVVMYMSDAARIACNEAHGIIAFAPFLVPVVMAYSEEGELVWVIRVEGIRTGLEITENQGRTTFHSGASEEEGGGRLSVFQAFEDGSFYLAALKQMGDDRRRDLIFRVDPRTGVYEHVGSGRGVTVSEKDLLVGGSYHFGMEYPGFPQVIVKSRQTDQQ